MAAPYISRPTYDLSYDGVSEVSEATGTFSPRSLAISAAHHELEYSESKSSALTILHKSW